MKLYFFSIVTALVAMLLSSCSKDMTEYKPEEKEHTVSSLTITLGGECSINDGTPMSRAASDDLYGINIYQKNLETKKTTSYAYAIVDDISAPLSLLLVDNDGITYSYTIECSLLKNGKKLADIGDGTYDIPFNLSNGSTTSITKSGDSYVFESAVNYGRASYVSLSNLSKSPVYAFGSKERPFCERYYGSADIPVATNGGCHVELNMYRRYFGLNITAQSINQGAHITVQIEGANNITLTADKLSVSNLMVSHKTINTAESKVNDYNENIPVLITYYASDDAEGIVLSDSKKSFKRNYMYDITITDISENGNTIITDDDGNSGITIEMGDVIPAGNTDIIWSSR